MTDKTIKIVKIINETTFVLNAGKNDGIERGMEFKIMDSESEPITDPDTNQIIGYLDSSKGIIEAEVVQEKMTIARTKLHTKVNRSPIYDAMSAFQSYETSYREELNVDETQITGGYNKSNNPVSIGDVVVILSDPS